MKFSITSFLIIQIISVGLFLYSCKSGSGEPTIVAGSNPETAEKAIQLKLRPPKGSEYAFDTKNEVLISQTVNGNEINTQNKNEVTTNYNVREDSSDNYYITITYIGFKIKIKTAEIEKEVDASAAVSSSDPQERIFGAFNGSSFDVVLSADGAVKSIHGLDNISSKMYELANGNQQAISAIQNAVKQYLSEEVMKASIEQQFKFFPNKAITVGETWSRNSTVTADMKIAFPVNYKFQSISNNEAVIAVSGKFNLHNQPIQNLGQNVSVSLKGKHEGEIIVDVSSGMIKNSASTLNAAGSMQMMGMDIPVKLKTTTKVAGRRVK